MKAYVCLAIDELNNCTQWVEQSNFINELSQLTYQQSNELLTWTVAIFAAAWMWKRLSLTALR